MIVSELAANAKPGQIYQLDLVDEENSKEQMDKWYYSINYSCDRNIFQRYRDFVRLIKNTSIKLMLIGIDSTSRYETLFTFLYNKRLCYLYAKPQEEVCDFTLLE